MKKFLQAIGNLFNLKVLTNDEYNKLIAGPPKVDGPDSGENPTKPKTLLSYSEIVSMLTEYDNTRREHMISVLGFEDTRVNTFDFVEVKNYLTYTEKLAKEKGIQLKGISFIKGAYAKETTTSKNVDFISYENLMYLPTALIEGNEVQIDLVHSTKNSIVSFKDILAKNGYDWRYDNAANFITKKNFTTDGEQKQIISNTNEMQLRVKSSSGESLVANHSTIAPPYEAK